MGRVPPPTRRRLARQHGAGCAGSSRRGADHVVDEPPVGVPYAVLASVRVGGGGKLDVEPARRRRHAAARVLHRAGGGDAGGEGEDVEEDPGSAVYGARIRGPRIQAHPHGSARGDYALRRRGVDRRDAAAGRSSSYRVGSPRPRTATDPVDVAGSEPAATASGARGAVGGQAHERGAGQEVGVLHRACALPRVRRRVARG